MARLRSLLYAIFLIVTVIPYAFACVLWAPLPLHLRYKLTVGWPRLAIWGARVICGIRWQVKGWENLPDGPAVILSKHQSAWETLFFPAYMPREVCFVYKKELHMVPFFGWGLALLRMIAIDRSRAATPSSRSSPRVASAWTRPLAPALSGRHARAPGQAGRFKMGGALLASRTGAKVIPVAHNAGECWRRNAFVKRPGLVTLSIGPAIESQGLPEELNQKVQDWIEGEMRRLNPERYV